MIGTSSEAEMSFYCWIAESCLSGCAEIRMNKGFHSAPPVPDTQTFSMSTCAGVRGSYAIAIAINRDRAVAINNLLANSLASDRYHLQKSPCPLDRSLLAHNWRTSRRWYVKPSFRVFWKLSISTLQNLASPQEYSCMFWVLSETRLASSRIVSY